MSARQEQVTIETFWEWVNERHAMWMRRHAPSGLNSRQEMIDWAQNNLTNDRFEEWDHPPWTDNSVLAKFRFTNVFRELDRGTAICWTILNKCEGYRSIVENIVFYRVFNKPETARALDLPIQHEDFDLTKIESVIRRLDRPFTSAHMQMWGAGGWKKIFRQVHDESQRMVDEIYVDNTVENAYKTFRRLFNTGPFFAHQFAQDARFNLIPLAIDGDWWTQLGPGSTRCLEWMGYRPEFGLKTIHEMQEAQDKYRAEWVPRLEAKDFQQSLCEVQKYVKLRRMLTGDGKRCKARIYR